MNLKLIASLIFLQCFEYKDTEFGPVLELGLTITPDRFVFIIILVFAIWKFTCGELQFPGLGQVEYYMLLFTLICTVSSVVMGTGSRPVLYHLFDFIYNSFTIFILAKSVPHSPKKLESLSFAFLVVGAYLAINGAFEHFGLHTLVWPKYILDPQVGIQFGRTRGSFASSEGLGMALIVSFLFYAFYATRIKRKKLYWPYLMMLMTAGVIYTTNQRSVWVSFGLCLALLAIAKTEMKQAARVFIGLVLLGFVLGVGTHFSFWESGTLFSKRQETVSYRQANTLTTLAMGMDNPIYGVGFGNFRSEWPKYFRPIDGSEIEIRDLTDGNHNTFLGLFAEIGLVGLVPYLMIFCHMFRVGLRVYGREEGLTREFSLVFLLVVTSYMIGANFSDYRSGRFHNTVLFLLFGAVARIDVQAAILHSPVGRPRASRSPV